MAKTKVRVIVTGGTIDDLDIADETNVPNSHQSLIPDLLKRSRISVDYELEILMQKDSRAITDKDRELILEHCSNCPEDKIIISHGTFTIPETVRYLATAKLSKTIILFGSAIPANKEQSDALFNLGASFIACQTLANGVYVVMNGKVFTHDNVYKNLSTGYFKDSTHS